MNKSINYKSVQKEYNTKHDWVGKGINSKLCKTFRFDQTKQIGICTIWNPSWKMRRTRFFVILRSPYLGQTTKPGDSQKKNVE